MAAQVIIYDLAGRLSVHGADVAARELGKVNKSLKTVKDGFKGLREAGGHLMHASMGLAVIGTGVAAALGKMAHEAMDFEQKMAYVSALTGGKNTDEFRKFEMAARSAGVTTFASSSLAAEAIYDIKKAGFSTADTIAALNPVLALSSLENIKVAEAAKAAASMTRAFGLEAKKSGDMVDAMAFVSKNTSASIKNLKDGMTYTSTTARMLKYDYRDVLIMLGMLNNAGLEGSKAGTTLNAALLRLSGSSARGGKYIKALGIDLVYTAGAMKGKTKSASVLLKEMMVRYTQMDEKFGTLGAVQRWMKALGLVGGKFPAVVHEMMAYKDLLPKLTAGIVSETDAERKHSFAMILAERRMASTLGVFQLMGNAVSSFSIEISKANVFGDVFGEKFHKVLGIIRLAAASVGGYEIADRNKIMGAFGLSEETAQKVDKVVAGIKRGIGEAVEFAEKMYHKAAAFLKKQGGDMDIEKVAATATKVVLAMGVLGPAIFAAIPVVITLSGVFSALSVSIGALSGPAGIIAAITVGVLALVGAMSSDKPQSFGKNILSGLKELNDIAVPILKKLKEEVGGFVDQLTASANKTDEVNRRNQEVNGTLDQQSFYWKEIKEWSVPALNAVIQVLRMVTDVAIGAGESLAAFVGNGVLALSGFFDIFGSIATGNIDRLEGSFKRFCFGIVMMFVETGAKIIKMFANIAERGSNILGFKLGWNKSIDKDTGAIREGLMKSLGIEYIKEGGNTGLGIGRKTGRLNNEFSPVVGTEEGLNQLYGGYNGAITPRAKKQIRESRRYEPTGWSLPSGGGAFRLGQEGFGTGSLLMPHPPGIADTIYGGAENILGSLPKLLEQRPQPPINVVLEAKVPLIIDGSVVWEAIKKFTLNDAARKGAQPEGSPQSQDTAGTGAMLYR